MKTQSEVKILLVEQKGKKYLVYTDIDEDPIIFTEDGLVENRIIKGDIFDKKEWKKVFDGESTGKSSDYMTVFLDNAKGRYVRLCFERTSTGTWNSTNEIKVMQKQK